MNFPPRYKQSYCGAPPQKTQAHFFSGWQRIVIRIDIPILIYSTGDTSRRSTPYSSGQRRILFSSCWGLNSPLARGVPAGRGVAKQQNWLKNKINRLELIYFIGPIVLACARMTNDNGTLLRWSHRLAVRTSDSHSGNTGSIPVGTAKCSYLAFLRTKKAIFSKKTNLSTINITVRDYQP